jgi:hypothetical protein
MTGPRNVLVHPQRRRGRHLLPLLAALCGPLACSDDQTGPTPATGGSGIAATVSHPVPKAAGGRISTSSGAPYRVYPSLSSSAGAPAALMAPAAPSVLVLADTDVVSTNALTTSLANAGAQVTVRPGPEYSWDGTNPSLAGFHVVVHLNGSSYELPLTDEGQNALASFVANGGGYVGARWNGQEYQPLMADLVLQNFGGNPAGPEQTCGFCQITYETDGTGAGHPVLAGLPASFTFTADGHDAGPEVEFASNPSSVLMRVPSGGAGVLVRQLGAGRIVNFSFAPNYYYDDMGAVQDPVTLQDANIQQLYVNAVNWASGLGSSTAEAQSITFGPLSGKVFGDADFAISASASSGLPVNFTSTGGCTVVGSMVSIAAAGSCTVTAHQAGNDEYLAAEDVAQSFQIQQAVPSIHWSPAALLSGTPLGPSQLNATATGVGGAPISGTFAYTPSAGTSFGAGTVTLSTQFTPASSNYTGASRSLSIAVSGAMNFAGFYAPLKNLPYVNTVMAGSAIPVKFSLGAYRGLNVLQGGAPASTAVECPAGAPSNPVRPGIAGSSGLKAVGSAYSYVWRTSPSWGGTCRKLMLTLADGSTHEALFRFTAAAPATTSSTARRLLGR